jgi:hypothetical protein
VAQLRLVRSRALGVLVRRHRVRHLPQCLLAWRERSASIKRVSRFTYVALARLRLSEPARQPRDRFIPPIPLSAASDFLLRSDCFLADIVMVAGYLVAVTTRRSNQSLEPTAGRRADQI